MSEVGFAKSGIASRGGGGWFFVRITENVLPRTLAALLALGGSFWGVLLSASMLKPEASPLAWLFFGPGYLVTLGYLVRTVTTPSVAARRMIWICSILVQGAWLLVLVWDVVKQLSSGRSVNEPRLFAAWWIFATVASVVGLFAERPTSTEQSAADQPQNNACVHQNNSSR